MTRIYLAIIALLTLTSCEKVIDLKLKDAENKFVVEGNITNLPGPYFVKLSKSVPFDQSSVYPAITDAHVTIEDSEGNTDNLTHIGGGVYETHTIKGMEGRTYHLKVIVGGEVYTASTMMPKAVELDSISVTTITFGTRKTILLIPGYTDPATTGNNYKFNLFVNGIRDKSYMVWNDAFENGKVNERPIGTSDPEDIASGDDATIEMECLNDVDYRYYFTLSQMDIRGPGGGTTPTNPQSNISNGAVGLFSAHTISEKSIIVPEIQK